jgi:hypothetical protein
MSIDELLPIASSLLPTKCETIELHPLTGGANNRIYRIAAGEKNYILKQYFSHASDPRDRFSTEFNFMQFVWERGILSIPEPLSCDRSQQVGLYEFINGEKVTTSNITWDYVEQALQFFLDLNIHKEDSNAENLKIASEACFSIREHLELVEGRTQRLHAISQDTRAGKEACIFVKNELLPLWDRIKKRIIDEAFDQGLNLDESLELSERCLSPSDFGFHNALITDSKRLYFFDFEYAGWDDPVKFICDFFSQVAIPVPLGYFEKVSRMLIDGLNLDMKHQFRMKLLFPLYQLKWCCIILNHFLTADSLRKQFAIASSSQEKNQLDQLNKAKQKLNQIISYLG